MVARGSVPVNVQRALWAESVGYCMNPECDVELIDEVSIADQAHIVEHSVGGRLTADNLILLCANCHRKVDGTRTDQTPAMMNQWKASRRAQIHHWFAKKYATFSELETAVVPLLERNGQIFAAYGPSNQNREEMYDLWLKFEPEILANNSKLAMMLNANRKLLPDLNHYIVDDFVGHVKEFAKTRDHVTPARALLFPEGLCSVFGIKPLMYHKPYKNVSALQNFISHLIEQNAFLALELEDTPNVQFIGNLGVETLYLHDIDRVRQLYWSTRSFRPTTTPMELDSLAFFLSWLSKRNIPYEFDDPRVLTKLTLKRTHEVFLCYEYCLAVAALYELPVSDDALVVNLYTWNMGGRITSEACEYAADQNFQVFTQKEFFAYAHKNIK